MYVDVYILYDKQHAEIKILQEANTAEILNRDPGLHW